jgi:hypothetical protein
MKTWTTLERTGIDGPWPPGPWDNEPDRASWTDETTGLPCLIVRNRTGALCGYVGVEPGHPWHGVGYNDCTLTPSCDETWCEHAPIGLVNCAHCELTYAAGCQHGDDPATGICHIPDPGHSDDVWWFGFDCAHHLDVVPGMIGHGFGYDHGAAYRDLDYVRSRVEALAGELAAVGDGE